MRPGSTFGGHDRLDVREERVDVDHVDGLGAFQQPTKAVEGVAAFVEARVLVAALPVGVALVTHVEARAAICTDEHVVGADVLALRCASGFSEATHAELGLNELCLDHDEERLPALVGALDEQVAVDAAAS